MRDILDSVSSVEAGKRFLINLADCLSENHIAASLAHDLISEAAAVNGKAPFLWKTFLSNFADLIFANPDRYQFQGPSPGGLAAEWITVKSLADLVDSMRWTSGLPQPELRAVLGLATLEGPHTGIREDRASFIAEMINDEANGFQFALAKAIPHPDTGVPRFAPSWYSRWSNFAALLDVEAADKETLAGRLRDWLGLGHYKLDNPLYLFRARAPFDASGLHGHRPTLFDGFDNKLYKHRCSEAFRRQVSGSTMDISKVRAAASADQVGLEGGPEIVSRGIWFSPDRFACEYVGKTPALNFNLDADYVHRLMLPKSASFPDVISRLLSALIPNSGGGS